MQCCNIKITPVQFHLKRSIQSRAYEVVLPQQNKLDVKRAHIAGIKEHPAPFPSHNLKVMTRLRVLGARQNSRSCTLNSYLLSSLVAFSSSPLFLLPIMSILPWKWSRSCSLKNSSLTIARDSVRISSTFFSESLIFVLLTCRKAT